MLGQCTTQSAWPLGASRHNHAHCLVSLAYLLHLSVGLDVTMQCQLPSAECTGRFDAIGGPLAVVSAMTEVWASERAEITFHDPLAAAMIFEPGICEYESGRVAIETQSPHAPGTTYFYPGGRAEHTIATRTHSEAFFEHYFGVAGTSV